jgi:hypothetical protein
MTSSPQLSRLKCLSKLTDSILILSWLLLNWSAWPQTNSCNRFESSSSLFSGLFCLHLCLAFSFSTTCVCTLVLVIVPPPFHFSLCTALLYSFPFPPLLVRGGLPLFCQIFLWFVTLPLSQLDITFKHGCFLLQSNITFIVLN